MNDYRLYQHEGILSQGTCFIAALTSARSLQVCSRSSSVSSDCLYLSAPCCSLRALRLLFKTSLHSWTCSSCMAITRSVFDWNSHQESLKSCSLKAGSHKDSERRWCRQACPYREHRAVYPWSLQWPKSLRYARLKTRMMTVSGTFVWHNYPHKTRLHGSGCVSSSQCEEDAQPKSHYRWLSCQCRRYAQCRKTYPCSNS